MEPPKKTLKSLLNGFISKKTAPVPAPPKPVVPRPLSPASSASANTALNANRKRPLEGGGRDMKPSRNLHVSNLAPSTTERCACNEIRGAKRAMLSADVSFACAFCSLTLCACVLLLTPPSPAVLQGPARGVWAARRGSQRDHDVGGPLLFREYDVCGGREQGHERAPGVAHQRRRDQDQLRQGQVGAANIFPLALPFPL